MPQELHVLKCFSCETFQVQIVKKSNKWECKMCGEKQSVKKVYGRGSGKDCRAHVQKLNELRLKKEEFIDPSLENCNYQNNECAFQSVDLEDGSLATKLCKQTPKLSNENDEPSYPMKRNSKWSEFLASGSSTSSDDDDDDSTDQTHFKPHRGDNSRKTIKKQKIAYRHEEQFKLENKWNNFASNASKVCAEDSNVHLNMSKEPTTYWRNVNSFLDVGVKNTNVFGDLGNVPDNISNSIRSKSLEQHQHSISPIPKLSGKKKICSPKQLDINNVKIVSNSKWSAFVNTKEEGSLDTFSKCPSIASCKQVKICPSTATFHSTTTCDIGKLEKASSALSDKKSPFNLGPLYSSQAEIGGASGNSANDMTVHRTIGLKDGEERPSYVATNCHQKTTLNAQPYIFDYNEEELDDIFNI